MTGSAFELVVLFPYILIGGVIAGVGLWQAVDLFETVRAGDQESTHGSDAELLLNAAMYVLMVFIGGTLFAVVGLDWLRILLAVLG
ncbi:MAG: hypothetical protein ACOCPZ_03185 [Natrialbaceae archaeon]